METVIATGTPAFGVEGRHAGGVTALRAAGRLVAGVGAGHPAWQTARDWRGASRVVVNLAGVTAIDAGGVGALLRLRQSAGRHGVPVTIEAARAAGAACAGDSAPRRRFRSPLFHGAGTEQRSAPGTGLAAPLAGALSRCA